MKLTTTVPNSCQEPAAIIAAAERGEAWAQNWLGVQNLLADDPPKDSVPATPDLVDLVANQSKRDHVPKELVAAIEWFRKAALKGDRDAQSNLGGCYREGIGVEQDAEQADQLFRAAADQGQHEAQAVFGFLCEKKGDLPQAAYWYRRSAEQGNPTGQNNLAVLLLHGKGVPQDYVEAYKWYNLAAAQGDNAPIEGRAFIAKKMTREQIAEGQRRAAEFAPKDECGGGATERGAPADSSGFQDVTALAERLELFEERLELRIEALKATFFISTNNVPWLRVCGEVHPRTGVQIKHHVRIVVDVYDASGGLVNTGCQWLSEPGKFFGFESFSVEINVEKFGKLRVYPRDA